MVSKNEVEKFLNEFKYKLDFYGILFRDDRPKNMETLSVLEILSNQRIPILKSLAVEDYAEGPISDKLNKGPAMWVFGKYVKHREIYIKITLGYPNNKTICISFHISEHQLKYKFK